jgi:hypothetical protein
MRILALDISTKTGYAVFEDGELKRHGLIQLEKKILEYGKYPDCYLKATSDQADRLVALVELEQPDIVVVEETNKARAPYTQKCLEFIHCVFLFQMKNRGLLERVRHIKAGVWRQKLGLVLTKEDKKANTKLAKAKKKAEQTGQKLDRTALGIRGRINKKHVAVRYVNEHYNLNFKVKDNDKADAICLGAAYLEGAEVCDGT